MIPPYALLKFNAANIGSDGAALTAVKPAIGPPSERIGDRMGILHAESGKQNFRIGIGHVIAIAVRIKEQIGGLQHKHAAVAEGQATGQIQTGKEILGGIGMAIAIGVFKDSDAIGTFWSARGRLRNLVV